MLKKWTKVEKLIRSQQDLILSIVLQSDQKLKRSGHARGSRNGSPSVMQQKIDAFLIWCLNDSVRHLQKLLFPTGSLLSDGWLCWDQSYLLRLIIKCPHTSSSSGSTSSASTGLCVMTALCQARRRVWLLNLTPWRAALQVDQSQTAHDGKICSEEMKEENVFYCWNLE